jgi:hypothetical protein
MSKPLTDAEVRAVREMLNEKVQQKDYLAPTFCGLTAREVIDMQKENERMREALTSIASCESKWRGDVVDIARTTTKRLAEAIRQSPIVKALAGGEKP